MRKYLFVFCAILAYLLFCSKSCEAPENENNDSPGVELAKIKDSIKNEFETEDLAKMTLQAFQEKAMEKLVDFSDYLNLYADPSMDDTLKDQVRQMISELFISENVRIKIRISSGANGKGMKLNEFLMTDYTKDYDSIIFHVDSIEVLKPLRRKDEISYTGILKFSQTTHGYSSSAVNFKQPEASKVEMVVVKVEKTFGADTLQVWKVFLGEME